MFTIYKLTNSINGESYIGYTLKNPPEKRFEVHVKDSSGKSQRHLHRAMRKYGVGNFSFEILKQGKDDEWGLKVEEPYHIGLWRPEYNMTEGGDGTVGWTPSLETKNRMKLAQEGKKHSTEHRNKNRISRLGKRLSLEHRASIRSGLLGKRKSPEHRAAISAAMMGNKNKTSLWAN